MRLLAIVGPTASGKTQLGIALARALGGEILSADSQQIYRGMEIGTAKPTAEERAAVPHHLLDLAEPAELLSAGAWAREAERAIAEVAARGALPIIVGGTGLWLRALLHGLVELPEVDRALRVQLMEEGARLGSQALHTRLAAFDPKAAATIEPANLQRVVRALEILEQTGEGPSAHWERHRFRPARYQARLLGLSPPRELLYARIDARAAAMFREGLLEEARLLMERYPGAPALERAIGYREARAVLEGEMSIEKAIESTAMATRRYAKRQLTWFRREEALEWLPWPVDVGALIGRLGEEGWRGNYPVP